MTKGHRRCISSGSIVDENSVPAILTKFLDCKSLSFWMKIINVDQIPNNIALFFLERKLLRLPYLTMVLKFKGRSS